MNLCEKILSNNDYLKLVKKIENTKFITDGKWDWEHGLGHYKRVAEFVRKILVQLGVEEREIELGMVSALLHDIGLSKGDKKDHAIESSKLFERFISEDDVSEEEVEMLRQAISDHSKGKEIKSLVGLALVLADKLDVTYHRVENSSIHDYINNNILKIKDVDIIINENELIVKYVADPDFDVSIFTNWEKAITIPEKVAKYLNKTYVFLINEEKVNSREILGLES